MNETEQERLRQVFLEWAKKRDDIDMSGYSEVEIEFGCFIAGYDLAAARAEVDGLEKALAESDIYGKETHDKWVASEQEVLTLSAEVEKAIADAASECARCEGARDVAEECAKIAESFDESVPTEQADDGTGTVWMDGPEIAAAIRERFTLHFNNGARLECEGMDNPDSWRGPNTNFAYIDSVPIEQAEDAAELNKEQDSVSDHHRE